MSIKKIIEPAGFKYMPWVLIAIALYLLALIA